MAPLNFFRVCRSSSATALSVFLVFGSTSGAPTACRQITSVALFTCGYVLYSMAECLLVTTGQDPFSPLAEI